MSGTDLATHPVHLGPNAIAAIEPAFAGEPEWFVGYLERHLAEGTDIRVVTQFTFREPWSNWETHPHGHEVVLCISGAMVLHQEHPDGRRSQVTLRPGQYAINAPGVWHTVDVADTATGVFITAGLGTVHRPR